MSERHITAKRAWAAQAERARLGEKFGFIACLGLLLKSGEITREKVLEKLLERGITRADLARFREQRAL